MGFGCGKCPAKTRGLEFDMPERLKGPVESTGNQPNVNCFNCASPSTELVEMELIAAPQIYRCKMCGYVDWLEQPPGKRT